MVAGQYTQMDTFTPSLVEHRQERYRVFCKHWVEKCSGFYDFNSINISTIDYTDSGVSMNADVHTFNGAHRMARGWCGVRELIE